MYDLFTSQKSTKQFAVLFQISIHHSYSEINGQASDLQADDSVVPYAYTAYALKKFGTRTRHGYGYILSGKSRLRRCRLQESEITVTQHITVKTFLDVLMTILLLHLRQAAKIWKSRQPHKCEGRDITWILTAEIGRLLGKTLILCSNLLSAFTLRDLRA